MASIHLFSGKERLIILTLLLLTLGLLVTGMILPMVMLTKLVFWDSMYSIVSGIVELFSKGYYFLMILIAAFSVVLPLAKWLMLFLLTWYSRAPSQTVHRYLKLIHEYGRWAILDVMVVAVLVVVVKLDAIAEVEVKPGLYIFTCGVILMMLLTHYIVKRVITHDVTHNL